MTTPTNNPQVRIFPTIHKTFCWEVPPKKNRIGSIYLKRGTDGEGEFLTEAEALKDYEDYIRIGKS